MKIALIDYNMGNLNSVAKALEASGGAVELVTSAAELDKFSCAVLPGVGNFGDGSENLQSRDFFPAIRRFVAEKKTLLGICLGMQLMLEESSEAPGMAGIGLIPGAVKRFPSGGEKVPHMGWNTVEWRENPLCTEDGYFYFVHSYYVEADTPFALAKCRYITDFAPAAGDGENFFGVQFHPEKSQKAGLRLLENFVRYAEKRALKAGV